MALDTDLQYFKSAVVSNDSTNGGRMSSTAITSGVEQNVWPHVFKAERDAGSTKYRKVFLKLNNDDNDSVDGNQIYLDLPTPGDDWIVGFVGTDTDTQADIVGTERKYGTANLYSDANSTGSTIVVTVENVTLTTGNDQIFKVGDKIRITSKATPDASTGDEEVLEISAVSVAGNNVTITTTAALVNSYTVASGARVSTLYEPASAVQATMTSLTVTTSGTLDYDYSSYPIILNNRGCVSQTFTLTFTDASSFTVTGDSLTGLASGNISTDYSAANPNFSGTNYIEFESAGWSGTAVAGDTVEIVVKQAAVPMWFKRVVPASSGSLANNRTVTAWAGESL